jgi:DNA integrity scanning protein DisA with diadenylate cyclase activity
LKQLKDSDDDVYFIDEAYQLVEAHNSDDKTILDYLLAEIESLIDKMIFVFADYRRQMKKFFEHNSELLSRLSYVFSFENYIDVEFLKMLQFQMSQFYIIEIIIEDEFDELYMQIVVRKLERKKNRNEFKNARALKNMFQRIKERQAERLIKQRKKELSSNDFYITKKNLIDSDSSKTILICDA